MTTDFKNQEIVMTYHERTKHYYHRFSASAGTMDWATQPNPFRRYDGAPLVHLPFPQRRKHFRIGDTTSSTA
ncbi:MAG: hypothetical protein ACI9JL_004261 [Paracoccaceae bacterium]|jgi:hypothetical protein